MYNLINRAYVAVYLHDRNDSMILRAHMRVIVRTYVLHADAIEEQAAVMRFIVSPPTLGDRRWLNPFASMHMLGISAHPISPAARAQAGDVL